MKIALAHPGVGPFVQQTARALLEDGLLASYWTTFVDKPEAIWRRALTRTASAIGRNIDRDLARRAVKEVPETFLRLAAPLWEVARSVLIKMRADVRLVDAVWEHGILSFDRAVARAGLNGVNAIYGYEYSALATFQEAERRGIARLYEVPSPQHDFVEDLIQQEIERFPDLDNGTRTYFLSRQARRTERRRQEWLLADMVIANSNFTRDTYAAAGFDVSKVRVIPLGAPPVYKDAINCGGQEKPLRVLWAGSLSIHKGAHYLLSSWNRFARGGIATLDVYGAVLLPDKLIRNLPRSIRIFPTIPRAELFERYRRADVLVFPTLCDGFGMVVTEAFAHGLPVITTTRAGAVDLIHHGENGLIVPPGDIQALVDAFEWCATHRPELKAMRRAAVEAAAAWQWSDYRQALARNIRDGLRETGYAR